MNLADLYDGLDSKKRVLGVCSKIENIRENYVFVNLENASINPNILAAKGIILIVSKTLIYHKELPCVLVSNVESEYIRLVNLVYKLDDQKLKKICLVNDMFLDIHQLLRDSFKLLKNENIYIINSFDNIDSIYLDLSKQHQKQINYFLFVCHSEELERIWGYVEFDYILFSKSSQNTYTKLYSISNSLLKNNGLLIYNYDDFYYDFNSMSNSISFSFESNQDYLVSNIYTNQKLITFNLVKENFNEEFLLCLSKYDYIYFIISLIIFFKNELVDASLIKTFLGKYSI